MTEHDFQPHIPFILGMLQAAKDKIASGSVEPFLVLIGLMLTILTVAAAVVNWYMQEVVEDFANRIVQTEKELLFKIESHDLVVLMKAKEEHAFEREDYLGQRKFDLAMLHRDKRALLTEATLSQLLTDFAVEVSAMEIYRTWVQKLSDRSLATQGDISTLRSQVGRVVASKAAALKHVDEIAAKQDDVRERLPGLERGLKTLQAEVDRICAANMRPAGTDQRL